MEDLYAEEFSYAGMRKRKEVPSLEKTAIAPSKGAIPAEGHTAFGYLRILEKTIHTESKHLTVLLPILQEINSALEKEDYQTVLGLVDDIEELIDLGPVVNSFERDF
jgi:hypothetical protein